MGSIGELIGMIVLFTVTGVFVLTACLCVIAKIADAETESYRHRREERP
jgi:hypothetical protein